MNVKSPELETTRNSNSLHIIQWALILVGTLIFVACLIWRLTPEFDAPSRVWETFLILGVGLFLVGLLLDWLPPAISLFIGSSMATLLLSLSILALLRIDPFETLDVLILRLFPPKVGIWKYDPVFGYNQRPGATGHFTKGPIDVDYHIDPQGFRVTPDPEDPVGRIVFLGGSFTFGTGVEDDEPYPSILGREYWTDYKVRNRAVTGWGTQHAYLSLLDEMKEEVPPKLVFYGWIAAHRERNYIRRSWVDHIGRRWGLTQNLFGVSDFRKHPHFEIENGELVFKGVVGPKDILDNPPDLREKEISITQKFLKEMDRLCKEKGIPLFLLNLPVQLGSNPLEESGTIEIPDYLLETIEQYGINFIDLQSAHRGSLPGDNHPSPETHQAIAEALAANPEIHTILYPSQEPMESGDG
ncbi:MAG: SGNH/GDSL hydrolase family protein [Candidatus Omnitrophica bacterium]|nr:SGNH/GDSL hydrolase family protein [Candidatus Omnitrophota bacterium]